MIRGIFVDYLKTPTHTFRLGRKRAAHVLKSVNCVVDFKIFFMTKFSAKN